MFRIRRRYFDQIVAGTKTVEYRRDTPFWQVRINNCFSRLGMKDMEYVIANNELTFNVPLYVDDSVQAIFICGKAKHVRQAMGIQRLATPSYFSDQGKKDVNTSTCLAFNLGNTIP